MSIQYNNIGTANTITQEYRDSRFEFISVVEGFKNGLYFDSEGVLTNGFGFNLTIDAVATEVIKALGLNPDSDPGGYVAQIRAVLLPWKTACGEPGPATSVQESLDNIMQEASAVIAGAKPSFVFQSPSDARAVLDYIADTHPFATNEPSYEQRINNKISGVPYSKERIVLFSLAYNGVLASSSNLEQAIEVDGNRAHAWAEIRYFSIDGNTDLVSRRYFEAEYFGLYDYGYDSKTPENKEIEAKSIYEAITTYDPGYTSVGGDIRNYIFDYEQAHSPDLDAKSNSLANVRSLEESLQPAADILIAKYGHDISVSPLDIYVGNSSANTIGARTRNGYVIDAGTGYEQPVLILGGDGDDIISGSSKDDALYGEGDSDTLIGNEGNDYLNGGAGADTLIGGAGVDILEGGAGVDIYEFDTSANFSDFINDSATDNGGVIKIGGVSLTGKEFKQTSKNGNTYEYKDGNVSIVLTCDSTNNTATLVYRDGSITGTIVINGFVPGTNAFGFDLQDYAAPAAPLQEGDTQTLDVSLAPSGGAEYTSSNVLLVKTGYLSLGDDEAVGGTGNNADTRIGTSNRDLPDPMIYKADEYYLPNATPGNFNFEGGKDNDVLAGSNWGGSTAVSSGYVWGGYGDILQGFDGDDVIAGDGLDENGVAIDAVDEGDNDILIGGKGDDQVYGGAGNDMLFAWDEWGPTFDRSPIEITAVSFGRLPGVWQDYSQETGQTNLDKFLNYLAAQTTSAVIEDADETNYLSGGLGDDWIAGGSYTDIIDGGADDDVIVAGKGTDTISGGDGNDVVFGDSYRYWYVDHGTEEDDAGDDLAYFAADFISPDTVQDWQQYYKPGTYDKADYADVIDGGAGNDAIFGEVGDDIIFGGDGDDVLMGDRDSARPVDGMFAVPTGQSPPPDIWEKWQALDAAYHGDDIIDGGDGDDVISGNGGDDILFGGAGADHVYGDESYVEGESLDTADHGKDTLYGGEGNDELLGGSNDDIIYGDEGNDTIVGDNGNDQGADQGDDTLYGGVGEDDIWGEAGNDTLVGGKDNDQMLGGAGNDTYIFNAGDGADAIYDDEGSQTLVLPANAATVTQVNEVVTINYGSGYVQMSQEDYSKVASIKTASGTNVKLNYQATSGDDDIVIAAGGDTSGPINGGAGNDTFLINPSGSSRYIEFGYDGNSGGTDIITLGSGGGGIQTTGLNFSSDADISRLVVTIVDGKVVFGLRNSSGSIGISGSGSSLRSVQFGSRSFSTNDTETSASDLYLGNGNNMLWQSEKSAIYGEGGDDYIVANGLTSEEMEQAIYDGEGNDTLVAGTGHDHFYNQAGDDTFIYATGAGQDYIDTDGYGNNGNDTLLLRGVAAEDVTLEVIHGENPGTPYTGNDEYEGGTTWLKISLGEGDAIFIKQFLDNDNVAQTTAIETIKFEYGGTGNAGTSWNISEIVQQMLAVQQEINGDDMVLKGVDVKNDTLTGDIGNDTLLGYSGNDVLSGGDGNDQLFGGIGADTLYGEDGNDILNSGSGNDVVYGGAGSDTITGGAGNDTLYGGEGDDTYIFNGKDGFQSGGETPYPNDGIDSISDANGLTHLVFTENTFVDLLDGNKLVYGAADVENGYFSGEVTLASGTDNIASIKDINGEDVVVSQSGTENDDVLTGIGIDVNDYIYGGSGNDTLYGGSGDDILIGAYGNDTLQGDAGADVYRFSAGDGNDVITASDNTDVIQLDVASSNVFIIRDEYGYLIRFKDSPDDSIRIEGTSGVNTISFFDAFDGTETDSWTLDDSIVLDNDRAFTIDVSSSVSNQNQEAPGGYDGDAYFMFTPDMLLNNDALTAGNWKVVDARVVSGIAEPTDFYFGPNPFNTSENIMAVWPQVVPENETSTTAVIEYFIRNGEDGPVYRAELNVNFDSDGVLEGTAADDFLDGMDATAVIIDGKAGNDMILGGQGDDTVLHRAGDNNDVLSMYDGNGINDQLVLIGDGDNSSPTFTQDGFDLQIHFNGEVITVQEYFHDNIGMWTRHGELGSILLFDDQTAYEDYLGDPENVSPDAMWTYDGENDGLIENNRLLKSTSGNDTIIAIDNNEVDEVDGLAGNDFISARGGDDTLDGGVGNDTLVGGSGNDTLVGGAGSDTYQFAYGDGQDIIQNNDANADEETDVDILEITGVTDYRDLWLHQDNDDLVIKVLGSSNQITVENWFAADDSNQDENELDVIRVTDTNGTWELINDQSSINTVRADPEVNDSGVDQFDRLIHAMASFEGTNGVPTTAPGTLNDAYSDNAYTSWLSV